MSWVRPFDSHNFDCLLANVASSDNYNRITCHSIVSGSVVLNIISVNEVSSMLMLVMKCIPDKHKLGHNTLVVIGLYCILLQAL